MKASKAIISSILAIVSLVAAQFLSQLLTFLPIKNQALNAAVIIVGAFLYAGLTYFFIKIICEKYLHVSLPSIGVTKFSINWVWGLSAFLLPVAVVAVFLLAGGSFNNRAANVTDIIFNVFYGSLAAGFVEELVFRGLILNVLAKKWNYWVGIFIPSLVFASLHVIGRSLSFLSILQLLLAGTLVGIMFSLIELSCQSFWNDALVHAIWNLVTSAIILVSTKPADDAMVTFVPKLKAFWFTGGDFGMESSVVAIAGYLLVSLVAWRMFKNKRSKN